MKFGRLQNGLLRSQPETAPSNFISNPTPLKDTTGWSLYSDAAGIAPVDGTGGSVNTGTEINWSRTTSSPLSETASFLFSKIAASSMQGKGVSYDFTVNHGDKSKVCRIDFDYEVVSGTYADGDLTVWLYDVTNGGNPIQPSASSILNAIGPQKKQPLSFQTNSNSTSYRLIIHVASTSASAYTVKFDNVSVTRESISQGTVVTDWVSYTPTTAGLGTVSGIVFSWRRVGDSVEILGRLNTGTPTATFATISLPSGLIADTAKISSSGQVVGSVLVNTSITSVGWYLFGTGSSSNLNIGIRATTTTSGFAYSNGNAISNSSGDTISLIATVPIQGWSSSQQLSSDADTRAVAMTARNYSNGTLASGASHTVILDTVATDTHGAYNSATGEYTVKVPGNYSINGEIGMTATAAAATRQLFLYIRVNGTGISNTYTYANTTSTITHRVKARINWYCNAGDVIKLIAENDLGGTGTPAAGVGNSNFSINLIQGPAQIAASEAVNAKRYSSSTAAVYNSPTTVAWTTSDYDSHGGFGTSSVYTVKTPGKYQVTARVNLASVSASAVERIMYVSIRQSGAVKAYSPVDRAYSTTGREYSQLATTTLNCIVGDTIDIQVFQNLVTSTNVNNNGGGMADNFVCIERIG